MSGVQLIVIILLIGFGLWAVNYLFGKYIKAEFLDLATKVAFVVCIAMVVYWVLSFFGIVPAVDLWKR